MASKYVLNPNTYSDLKVGLGHPTPGLHGELLKKTYVFGNVTPVWPWYFPPRSA